MSNIVPQKDHSDWGGSVAEKWINCPGYVNAVKNLPADPGNIHTAGGTAQHALIELVAKEGKNPRTTSTSRGWANCRRA